jgi:hypothetical protein
VPDEIGARGVTDASGVVVVVVGAREAESMLQPGRGKADRNARPMSLQDL